jgi:site-specific DNA recombinase
MVIQLPSAGGAGEELVRSLHRAWQQAAALAGIDTGEFDPNTSLERRLNWARGQNLEIASALSRFSTKMQDSTESQLLAIIKYAAEHRFYVPPEFVCVDEAQKGRKQRRDGLDRMKLILAEKLVSTLLVFKVSRLFRLGYKGFQFVQENVVDEGLRAISVTQGIDTSDKKTWRGLMYMHGMMDDLLLETIADHCRAGLQSLFQQGFVTGALSVGFRPVAVPGVTKRGLPRTRPAVDEPAAKLIIQHFEWIRDGMPVKEGWRRWVKAGGPYDPRSTKGQMSYQAYRRMLSNRRLTGLWAFGRKRNQWSSKRDGNRQVSQPATEIRWVRSEDLRIVDDELFVKVQQRLAELKKGPRGPRKSKPRRLWDLTTGLFYCASCSTPEELVRFYQTGCRGEGMQCKCGDLCAAKGSVRRDAAVQAVCRKLQELIRADVEFVKVIVARAGDSQVDNDTSAIQVAACQRKLQDLSQQIEDLLDLAGQGTKDERERTKNRIRNAQSEHSECQVRLMQYERTLKNGATPVAPEEVEQALDNLWQLLDDAVVGKLGEDAVVKALSVFERMVGGKIMVHVEKRPGRKAKNVRATFRPDLVGAVSAAVAADIATANEPAVAEIVKEIEVWLREPPYLDRMAQRAYELVDRERRSYRSAAKVFKDEGHDINSGKVWQLRKRYYEMIGEKVPDRPYNGGHPRKPR